MLLFNPAGMFFVEKFFYNRLVGFMSRYVAVIESTGNFEIVSLK